MKTFETQKAICPQCGHDDLEYSTYFYTMPSGDNGYYPIWCPKCGFHGREHYRLHFAEITHEDGSAIVLLEAHPVKFTPKQIDFIQENLIELANQYAHVQELVDGAIDIEETIVKAEHGIKE